MGSRSTLPPRPHQHQMIPGLRHTRVAEPRLARLTQFKCDTIPSNFSRLGVSRERAWRMATAPIVVLEERASYLAAVSDDAPSSTVQPYTQVRNALLDIAMPCIPAI